jgi:hypothetical protein
LNLWDELASWAVAGLLVALIVATMPRPGAIRDLILGRPRWDDPSAQGPS